MPRVKIQLADNIKRVVTFDSDATVGARLGANLLMPDGKIGTPASVLQWLGGALPSQPSGGGNSGIPVGNYLTTKGDLLTRDTQVQRLPIGTTGQALLVAAGLPAWGVTGIPGGGTGFSSYTLGDLLYADSTASLAKRGIGAAGDILKVTAGLPQWIAPAALTKTDDTNVTLTLGGSAATALINAASLTLGWAGTLGVARGGTNLASYTAGDLLYATGATTLAKRAIGATNDVLTVVGGVPTWAAVAASSPLTTKGDIYGFSTVNARIPVGANGEVLTADSTQTLGVKWAAAGSGSVANPTATIGLTAVNGSASSAIRSDGAPALSQAITPIWTGLHTFNYPSGTMLLLGTTTVNANPKGGSDAAHQWDMASDGTYQCFRIATYGTGGFQNNMHWQRARGTLASPTAVQSGDTFMSMGYRGYNGSAISESAAAYAAVALENWSTGANGIQFRWEAAPIGTATRVLSFVADGSGVSVGTTRRNGLFRVQSAASDDAGLEINRLGSTTMGTLTFDRANGVYVSHQFVSRSFEFDVAPSPFNSASVIAMILSNTGALRLPTYGSGALTSDASGNITSVSDEGVKRNIRRFKRGLDAIAGLKPILHGYKKESGLDQTCNDYAGFSAQNVEKHIPEAIGRNAAGQRTFSDRPVTAALVNAVQELSARLQVLEALQ